VLSARSFLVSGLIAGLLAGIVAFGVAFVVGEPSVDASVTLEESGGEGPGSANAGHAHADEADAPHADSPAGHEAEVVPRSLQSTAGLLTGTVVAGVTLGGLVGVLSALALGRFGRVGPRATTLAVTAAGFLALYAVPTLAYPANPPAVGREDTIGYRTALYFILMAISVIALVVAVLVGRRLAPRWGGWHAGIAAAAGYLLVTVAAIALLPTYDEVPASFPATLLYEFRRASLLIQLTLWTVLGVVLAELTGRSVDRSAAAGTQRSPAMEPVA
jgi:predicted cobalt transporter CbtA